MTDDGATKLVKWHWKSRQGRASLVWTEAQRIAGANPDYHRQDLWNAIESGHFPEWELMVQVIDEEDALAFGFDVLDPTKIIPVEYAPLQPLGVMRLDANPVNYFAETEQIMVLNIITSEDSLSDFATVSTWPHRPWSRFYRGPSPSGSYLLVPGHTDKPSRQCQFREPAYQ